MTEWRLKATSFFNCVVPFLGLKYSVWSELCFVSHCSGT